MYSDNKANKHRWRNNTFDNDRRTKKDCSRAEDRLGDENLRQCWAAPTGFLYDASDIGVMLTPNE